MYAKVYLSFFSVYLLLQLFFHFLFRKVYWTAPKLTQMVLLVEMDIIGKYILVHISFYGTLHAVYLHFHCIHLS